MPLPMAIRVTSDGFPNNLASHDPGWADMVNPNHPPNHIMIGAVRTDRTEKFFPAGVSAMPPNKRRQPVQRLGSTSLEHVPITWIRLQPAPRPGTHAIVKLGWPGGGAGRFRENEMRPSFIEPRFGRSSERPRPALRWPAPGDRPCNAPWRASEAAWPERRSEHFLL